MQTKKRFTVLLNAGQKFRKFHGIKRVLYQLLNDMARICLVFGLLYGSDIFFIFHLRLIDHKACISAVYGIVEFTNDFLSLNDFLT